jgi:folate-dependent phosphoribosylglycinamide formyltransferase PurN
MERIALFNFECFSSSAAIISFIEKHHDKLVLVVSSQGHGVKHYFKELVKHYRRSGLSFIAYFIYSLTLYFWAIHFFHLVSILSGRPRRFFTVSELCRKYNIELIKSANVNSPDIRAKLQQANLDYIVVYYFDQILKQQTIDTPKRGVLNVHSAYLPQCRGPFPEFYTALRANRNFGITVHQIVDNSIDVGPILAQTHVDVPKGKSILLLSKIIHSYGVDLVSDVIERFDVYSQNKIVQGEGSYYSFPTREDIKEARKKRIRLCSFPEFLGEFL